LTAEIAAKTKPRDADVPAWFAGLEEWGRRRRTLEADERRALAEAQAAEAAGRGEEETRAAQRQEQERLLWRRARVDEFVAEVRVAVLRMQAYSPEDVVAATDAATLLLDTMGDRELAGTHWPRHVAEQGACHALGLAAPSKPDWIGPGN
jgi:hypothetical protein